MNKISNISLTSNNRFFNTGKDLNSQTRIKNDCIYFHGRKSKVREEQPTIYGANYDYINTIDKARMKTVPEIKMAKKNGENIHQDRNALIVSRIPIAIKDAKKFISKHPEFNFDDVVQDLIQIIILKTDVDLKSDSQERFFSHYYASASKTYFNNLIKRKERMSEQPSGITVNYIQKDPYKALEEQEARVQMHKIVSGLPEPKKTIVYSNYGIYGYPRKSLSQLAKEYGVTKNVISEQRKTAERMLGTPKNKKILKRYTEE